MKFEGAILPEIFFRQYFKSTNNLPITFDEQQKVNTISLDYFRKLYVADIKYFHRVTKELALRGAKFIMNNISPLFPKTDFDVSVTRYIYFDELTPTNAYENIDFELVNIRLVMDNFDITSNDFYMNLPIDGFKVFSLQKEEIRLLCELFIQNGFKISGNELVKPAAINIEGDVDLVSDSDLRDETSSNKNIGYLDESVFDYEEFTNNQFKKIISYVGNNPILSQIKLKELIKDNDLEESSKLFSSEYSNYKIEKVNDFKSEQGVLFINQLSIEDTTLLIKVIKQVFNNYSLLAIYCSDFILMRSELKAISFLGLFPGSSWSLLRQNAYELDINNLGDLNYKTLLDLFQSRGIGTLKVRKIIELLGELHNDGADDYLISDSVNCDISKDDDVHWAHSLIRHQKFQSSIKEKGIGFITKAEVFSFIEMISENKREKKQMMSEAENNMKSTTLNFTELHIPIEFNFSIIEIIEIFDLSYNFEDSIEFIKNQVNLQPYLNMCLKDIFEIEKKEELPIQIIQLLNYFIRSVDCLFNVDNNFEHLLTKNEKIVFKKRVIESEATLQELGIVLDVTRERVRQIENKVRRKLINYLQENDVKVIQYSLEKNLDYIMLPNDSYMFLNTLLNRMNEFEGLFYSSAFNILTTEKHKNLLSKLEYLLSQPIGENTFYFSLEDLILKIRELRDEANSRFIEKIINDIEFFIEVKQFKLLNGYVLPHKLAKYEICIFIIKNFFNESGMNVIDYNDLEKFQYYFQRVAEPEMYYDFFENAEKNEISRKIIGLLDRQVEHIVKVDSNKYIAFDMENIPNDLLNEIAKFVTSELNSEVTVYAKKIFAIFEDKLSKKNITEYQIYNYLKLFYGSEFEFSTGNVMRIYKKGTDNLTTDKVFYNKLVSMGGQCLVSQIADDLGVELYTVHQVASQSDNLIIINGTIKINEVKKEASSIKLIEKINLSVQQSLDDKGYVSSNLIFKNLRLNMEYAQELINAKITDDNIFMGVLKQLYPELQGHSKFLYSRFREFDTIDVFLSEVGEKNAYHRNDFQIIGEELGYSDVSVSMLVNKCFKQGLFVPLDEDYFIMSDNLTITDEQLSETDNYIKLLLDKKQHISLANLKGIRRKLPLLANHIWSVQLLEYIALYKLSYQKIEVPGTTYLTDPMIITWPGSNINYETIVNSILKDYEGNMHESNICRYLISAGLVKSNRKNINEVPRQFFLDGILSKDEIGMIQTNW